MSSYELLNPKQKEAVFCTEGPLLILAGAGSGKTRVLTYRIAHLIEDEGVNPWNIMAITFTNKAAGEMRERVDQQVQFGSESIWVSTFHSSCVRILRRHIDFLGYDTSFSIYDTDDQKSLMKEVCKKLNIDTKIYKERAILGAISSAKDNLVGPEEYEKSVMDDYGRKKIAMAYTEYQKELKKLQSRLGELHNRLYRKRVQVILTYEGWDAAGKGGNIKRITEALDPRGFEVHPIASPEPHEKARHYLWRFWTRLPKNGHIAIFDRTWYGRVMVERLEGFCSENDWRRAYNEINEFEKELSDWGAVIVKFWVQIDKDTQLARFNDRQNNPEKRWKITDEDWRNREKWDQYEVAVDEMLQKTSTTYAPWHILESVDKKYARLKALRIVIEELEKAMK